MKNLPNFPDDLPKNAKKVYDTIRSNRGISFSDIAKLTGMSETTVEKYLKQILSYDLIEYYERTKGRAYIIKSSKTKTIIENQKQVETYLKRRKSKIINCINSLENTPFRESLHAILTCINLILALDNVIKFLMISNDQKKPMKQWLKIQKENQNLLKKVIQFEPALYGYIHVDLQSTEREYDKELESISKKLKKRKKRL